MHLDSREQKGEDPGHGNGGKAASALAMKEACHARLEVSAQVKYETSNVANVNDKLGHEAILKVFDKAIELTSTLD